MFAKLHWHRVSTPILRQGLDQTIDQTGWTMTNKIMPGIIISLIAVLIFAAVSFIYNADQSEEHASATTVSIVSDPVKTAPQPLSDPDPVTPPEIPVSYTHLTLPTT